ncbi:ABC transporter permease [Beijerinckia sp. L45]|uniref:ABC transporter permease n=1 Tax=Beijerinckia sp. L45 TaxID=1641855 RepID=UPI001576D145|nr:ABC transporter permease subunit [Beijerinckia sp. L45]
MVRSIRFIASLITLVALWGVVAAVAHSSALPSPAAVALFIVQDSLHGDMAFNVGMSLWRVFASFIVAMGIGTAIGLVLGRTRVLDEVVSPWVLVLLNTPALVITALCYIWLGLNEFAAIVAVALNKIPNVAVLLREGVRSFDPALDDMAAVYRFSTWKRVRHVFLPQLAPFLTGAARSGLALVWKIVLVVELLGRPNGVGYAISYYFQLFDVRAVLGYSVVFSVVMLMIELLVLQPLDDYARRWRSAS